MSDILSQNEIESLLSSLSAVSEPEPVASQIHGSDARELSQRSVKLYDFKRSDRLSKEQLRGLRTVMDHFARQYSLVLSALLRVPVTGESREAEQLTYSSFVTSLQPSVLYVLESHGLRKRWVLQLSHSMILMAVDRLLGGPGHEPDYIDRPPSEIELALVNRLIQRALATLQELWRHIIPLELKVVSVETDIELAQIYPHSESVVVVPMMYRVRDFPSGMALCVPYVSLKPLAQQLSGRLWEAAQVSEDEGSPHEMAANLSLSRIETVARFPAMELTLLRLSQLQLGQVLPLRAQPEVPSVELRVAGRLKFIGTPGIKGDHIAVAISQEVSKTPGV